MRSSKADTILSEREIERYRRQLMLDGFTGGHQEILKKSTVLVAGIGGLGGTAALYLAVAGIGKMIFAHYGNLTVSNMNRQVLMDHDWIGQPRVLLGRRRILEINPDVEVEVINERTTSGNADSLVENAEIALSARPNFDERRTLNGACIKKGVPMIEAAMNGMEGYLFNVFPRQTACLQCVYPEDNPWWEELGFPVLGAVSGMLGCLMAVEAIKILTGYGKPLNNQMLMFNLQTYDFRKLHIYRDMSCPVCGDVAG